MSREPQEWRAAQWRFLAAVGRAYWPVLHERMRTNSSWDAIEDQLQLSRFILRRAERIERWRRRRLGL